MTRALTCGIATAAACLTSTTAFGATPWHADKKLAPPSSGHWVVDANGATNDTEATSGSFTVVAGHHRYVRALKFAIGPDADTACGTGNVSVAGKRTVYDVKGDGWFVGTRKGKAIHPAKVTISEGGKHVKGTLLISFIGKHGGNETDKEGAISAATVTYGGDTCDITFGIKRS
jgi:hypothetical protein